MSKSLGIERYASYFADGYSEYFGQGGYRVVSPPVHEVLARWDNREKLVSH